MPNNKGSRLLVPVVASAIFALGCIGQANADTLFGQIAPRFAPTVQQQQSGLAAFLRKLVQALKKRPTNPGPGTPPSTNPGNGRNVPELSIEVAGAAVVLLVGGVLVLTSRRRRKQRSAP